MGKRIVKSFSVNTDGLSKNELDKAFHPFMKNNAVPNDCEELKRRVDRFHEKNKDVISGAIQLLKGGSF